MVLEWISHGDALDAILKFYANQDLYTCIVPVPKPAKVIVDGKPLPESADIKAAQAGYFYDSANKALHIKYRVPTRKAALSVRW